MAPAARLLALGAVAVLVIAAARGADALRSLGAGAAAIAQGDVAVDLNATNFDAFLAASREPFAVVEFFAHWCPACRKYKPHYEKVAKLFNGLDAAHPGRVLMTRLDCARKVNIDLCSRFSVDHYPYLLWAPPTKFVNAKWNRKQEKSEIKMIHDGRTAERLLKWINKQTERQVSKLFTLTRSSVDISFTLDDKKNENEIMLLKMPRILNRLFEKLTMWRNSAI
ncbi:hypothetical protein QYE76_015646 [Lolium multiflorum]|uniref:Thioredoxin domain-containing protein n=1 Tax=Lolium multiflorum TaxID=4521 RepID=A0AAD8U6Y2_LOLMU|nr:hypothetical protein QYE76_015646 [Lolium multiflorum]